MGDKTSKGTIEKGQLLFREGKVEKELETEKRIHFKVRGETGFHSVIFDKGKKVLICDCPFFTLRQEKCSHIIASELMLEKSKG